MSTGFDADTTSEEVLAEIELRGKRILVTGASAGLGAQTVRVLRAAGAKVVGTARDRSKALAAIGPDDGEAGSAEIVALDLASLASVRSCADALLAAGEPFDLIIANAGVMHVPKGQTADGFETHFGTNFLGHFLLINRLRPLLHPGSRVVSLTSWGHNYSDIDLDDLNFDRGEYEEHAAYGRSKTANILFAVEFDRRHQGEGIRAAAAHPGGIATELYRHMDPDFVKMLVAPREDAPPILAKSVSQGAATALWAGLVAPADEVGGRYCEDCHVADVVDNADTFFGVRPYALDPARAQTLWAKAEGLVGERF